MAFERVKAEEGLGALCNAWSDAADRRFTHRPQDPAIATAFSVLLASRRKLSASVQFHTMNEEAVGPNARVPAWLRTEPTWPIELEPDAWWPRKAAYQADHEKTLAALVASADRALNLFWERLESKSAVQASTKHGLPQSVEGSRGRLTLIAAKACQEGSAKILASLEAAEADLKTF